MSHATASLPDLRPKDFLGIDHLLSDEERDIRDAVRAFVSDRVMPHVGEWFEEARIPSELVLELGRLGVLGMHLEGYGCAGASATAYGRARRDGDDWILHGQKMWITNGSVADVAVVWAVTDEGVRGFLVPKGTKGFSTQDIHRKLSLRASITSELLLDDVRVPADAMLPEVSSLKGPLSCLNEARYGIVWGAAGAGRACYEAALSYAKERIVFEKPIAATQIQ